MLSGAEAKEDNSKQLGVKRNGGRDVRRKADDKTGEELEIGQDGRTEKKNKTKAPFERNVDFSTNLTSKYGF